MRVLSRRAFVALAAVLPLPAWAESCCGPLTSGAARMTAFLDGCGVERLWLPGYKVEWDTGAAIHAWPTTHRHTHCSAFAASMAMRLGVYLLRPPEHSPTLLANAQMGWLRSPEAVAQAWSAMPDVTAAQSSANTGALVVAVFENRNPANPGHIAILRPSDIGRDDLLQHGPFTTQAGGHNWLSGPLELSFAGHRSAWHHDGTGAVRFFAHAVDWAVVKA